VRCVEVKVDFFVRIGLFGCHRDMTRAILLVAVLEFAIRGWAQTGAPKEAVSRNAKFSVEVSSTQLDKPLLSVFKKESGDQRVQVWSKSLEEQGELGALMGMQWSDSSKRISNDGKVVVLLQEGRASRVAAVRILTQQKDAIIEADDLLDVLDAFEDGFPESEGKCLELLLDSQEPKLFGIWHPISKKWAVIDLESLVARPPNPAEQKGISAAAVPYAREVVRKLHPSGLRKTVSSITQQLANALPMLAGLNAAPDEGLEELGWTAYRYLAHVKNPEDRVLMEELLSGELQSTSWTMYGAEDSDRPSVASTILTSGERILGDTLLKDWDGRNQPGRTEFELNSSDRAHILDRFGGIDGMVALPFGAPPEAGGLFIFLIPASVPLGKWEKSGSVLKAVYTPDTNAFAADGRARIVGSRFVFDAITPGEYRLKVLWDRRAPFSGTEPDEAVTRSAGDYESSESSAFKLAAGHPVHGVQLFCTNRIGTRQDYLAEDEKIAKEYPARLTDERPGGTYETQVLADAPVDEWVLRTNDNKGNLRLRWIRLTEARVDGELAGRTLSVVARIPGAADSEIFGSVKGELIDEHGCTFETSAYANLGSKTYPFNFDRIPLGARQIVLRLSRENMEFKTVNGEVTQVEPTILASFTLTNLFRGKPADWQPEILPAKRKFDLASVELTSVHRGAQEPAPGAFESIARAKRDASSSEKRPENTFRFSSELNGWEKHAGRLTDRWGNEGVSASDFCKEEEVFKYQVKFIRNAQTDGFLKDEQFEVPLTKVPGSGESVRLDRKVTLQRFPFRVLCIGGTGEFSYDQGSVVAMSNTIAEEKEEIKRDPFYSSPPRRSANAKLWFKRVGGFGGAPLGRNGQPETLAAKTPFLIYTAQSWANEAVLGIVEQDITEEDPLKELDRNVACGSPRTEHIAALAFKPAETNRTLTFVAQKPRKAEFIVRIPKGEDAPSK
jgi:hypothetical protein